jgi:hypothetical protein
MYDKTLFFVNEQKKKCDHVAVEQQLLAEHLVAVDALLAAGRIRWMFGLAMLFQQGFVDGFAVNGGRSAGHSVRR